VYFDARERAAELRNHARGQAQAHLIEFVRQPVQQNSVKSRITEEDLQHTARRRIFRNIVSICSLMVLNIAKTIIQRPGMAVFGRRKNRRYVPAPLPRAASG